MTDDEPDVNRDETNENAAAADVDAPSVPAPSDDRLTIRRLILLTVGVALGLVIFVPSIDNELVSVDGVRQLWFSLLAGVALVSPLLVIGRRLRGHRAGAGGMLLLTLGFGVLLLVPSMLAERGSNSDSDSFSFVCLMYCLPLVCLWYSIAAVVGGQLTRASMRKCTPWVERLGLYVALAGAPLGVWLLVDIYRDAF